ncbi:family 1 glycosylhydrolase [Amycolatopsis coloradensis]|nr:family 1 glycosylhydrolase [Amycolatopsis coloradensis]
MDSFEWAYGYAKRLGLVRVDRDTPARTIKRSGLAYRDIVERVRGGRR